LVEAAEQVLTMQFRVADLGFETAESFLNGRFRLSPEPQRGEGDPKAES
jgi:hypothetical protein